MKKLLPFAAIAFLASPVLAEVDGAIASDNGVFQIVLDGDFSQAPMRTFVEYDIAIYDKDDTPVTGATIAITGGMLGHGHGLPTRPEAIEGEDGHYTLRGLKFSMLGTWVVVLDISSGETIDRITYEFGL